MANPVDRSKKTLKEITDRLEKQVRKAEERLEKLYYECGYDKKWGSYKDFDLNGEIE